MCSLPNKQVNMAAWLRVTGYNTGGIHVKKETQQIMKNLAIQQTGESREMYEEKKPLIFI